VYVVIVIRGLQQIEAAVNTYDTFAFTVFNMVCSTKVNMVF